jgi:hypothetical protein
MVAPGRGLLLADSTTLPEIERSCAHNEVHDSSKNAALNNLNICFVWFKPATHRGMSYVV